MSEVLDTWQVLPASLISIDGQSDPQWENTVAALESVHSNRISEININVTNSRWERFATAMAKPFPELTHLRLWTHDLVLVLPDSFLGGSGSHLRTLVLERIPFPSLPKLLLSAHALVALSLRFIPYFGYFSPESIATALAVMTRLEFLDLGFSSLHSPPNPDSRCLLPPTRFVLPALTRLVFEGVYEYLEDLLAQIDPPRLFHLSILFYLDLNLYVPQLHRLIGHAEEFKTFDHADVSIYNYSTRLCLYPTTGAVERRCFDLGILCTESKDQLSSLRDVFSSSFPLISALEELQIRECGGFSPLRRNAHMNSAPWLELLEPFTSLKNLYLSDGIARHVCGALRELSGERATEVLPALRNLFVQRSSLEHVQEAMKSLVTARQLSCHPVVVDYWKD